MTMKFHEKLFVLRKAAAMTQNDLAEKLNVSRQAVSRWEMGTAMPDVENLIAISDLFSVTLDELLREGPVAQRQVPVKTEPRYWDYVPSKWWLPLILAVAAMICNYLWVFLYAAFPPSFDTSTDASGFNLLWIISRIFSPVGFNAMMRVFPLISMVCLIIGFLRWQKAKK